MCGVLRPTDVGHSPVQCLLYLDGSQLDMSAFTHTQQVSPISNQK